MKSELQYNFSTKLVAEFFNSIVVYRRILTKVANDANIGAGSLVQIEEALLLKQITEWEAFTRNIITYCVALDTTAFSKYTQLTLPKILTYNNANAILQGVNYTNFSNCKQLKQLANNIITKKNNPFPRILKPVTKILDDALIIRNHIAHKSNSSRNKLMALYKRYGITTYIEPGDFLKQTRVFLYATTTFSGWMQHMFEAIIVATWSLLDEKSYRLAFKDNKTTMAVGFTNMYIMFGHLSEIKDPISPI